MLAIAIRSIRRGEADHPAPQKALVKPQYPPTEQQLPLNGPPAHVYPPFVGPHVPSRVGTFEVKQALENPD